MDIFKFGLKEVLTAKHTELLMVGVLQFVIHGDLLSYRTHPRQTLSMLSPRLCALCV